MRRAISTHSRLSPGAEKTPHFAGRLPFGRLPSREQVAPQRRQVGAGRRLEHVRFDAERLQMIERGEVAEGHQHERRVGVVDQRSGEGELDRRLERDVEQQQRLPRKVAAASRGGLEQRRAIGRRRGGELRVEPLEQRREIGAAERQLRAARRARPGPAPAR